MSTFDDDPEATADELDRTARETADRLARGELEIRRQAIELVVETQRYLAWVAGQTP